MCHEPERAKMYAMLDRVFAREKAEARRPPPAPLVSREVREDHRTRVLSRSHTMVRDGQSKVHVDPAGRDGPTVEQFIKREHERVDVSRLGNSELGVGKLAFVVKDGSTIDRLRTRGNITYRQWQAGALYQSIHHLSRLDPKVVADYGQSMGGGQASAFLAPTEAVAAYRQQLRAARAALGTQLMVECVEAVVIADRTFFDVGLRLGNRGRSAERKGSAMVKAGLDALVGHFKLHNVRED